MDPQTVRMAATSSGATSPAPMAWRLPWTSNITFDMCASNIMRYEWGILFISRQCDGKPDCSDGWDENNCEYQEALLGQLVL